MDKFIRRITNFIRHTNSDAEHIPILTDYLKNHKQFKEKARDIHVKKESIKSSFWSSIDDLLKEEDKVKFIEDKSDKKK
jgi:hypothetical protein